MFEKLAAEEFEVGGSVYRLVPDEPWSRDKLSGYERELGWPFPQDYRTFLLEFGSADVFGAKLLEPNEIKPRGEGGLSDDGSPNNDTTVNFLPFAKRPTPNGGTLLFAFRFELDVVRSAPDLAAVAKGESRPAFLGSDYDVVAGHFPAGLSGVRFVGSTQRHVADFSGWVDSIVGHLRGRAQ